MNRGLQHGTFWQVLDLFGAKKLPELARSLGQSMNEFRKAGEDFDKELHAAGNEVKGAMQQRTNRLRTSSHISRRKIRPSRVKRASSRSLTR
jgi:TatA/E family protein of Tat protein translocase